MTNSADAQPIARDSATSLAAGSTVLAVDVGNTRAKFGLFRVVSHSNVEPVRIAACLIDPARNPSSDLKIWLASQSDSAPDSTILAGSDPDVRDRMLNNWPSSIAAPFVVDTFHQIPISIDVDVPERVGIDRLLNAHAVRCLCERDRSVVIVDSGTATTVDLVTSDGTFRGGSILPGLRLSAMALHDYTARLPLLDVDEDRDVLPVVPGRNTRQAIEAGLFVGQLGAVRELVQRLSAAARDQFGETTATRVVISGGGGRQLVRDLSDAIYVDSLALHGLALLASRQPS